MGTSHAGPINPLVPVDCASTAVQHVRRSTALLAGRPIAFGLTFLAELLLLRSFSRAEYGAFSYALAIIGLVQALATFEMSNTLGRWVPVFREKGHLGAVRGSVIVAFGFVAGVGTLAAVVVSTLAFAGVPLIDDPLSLRLLIVLALLIPIQGLDLLVTSLFAILEQTRAILIQSSFVKPIFRLTLVGTCVLLGTTIERLALGYLAIAAVGLVIYLWSLGRTLLHQGLWRQYLAVPASYPIRELLAFAAPLALTVVVWSLMESSDAILLGYFRGVDAVAAFRGVLPVAQLNRAVTITFAAMFLPAAAGLYARGDSHGLSDLYWKTAVWMAALTFPIFVCTFCFSRPALALASGGRYVDSAPVLALLSFGYFVNTALGFNGLTLKTFNRLRFTVSIDVAAAVLNVVVNLLAIPRWGATGAALGTCGTMVVHNLLKQYGLWKHTTVSPFERAYRPIYAVLFGVPLFLLAVHATFPAAVWVAVPLAVAITIARLWSGRRVFAVNLMFPEMTESRWWRALRTRGAAA